MNKRLVSCIDTQKGKKMQRIKAANNKAEFLKDIRVIARMLKEAIKVDRLQKKTPSVFRALFHKLVIEPLITNRAFEKTSTPEELKHFSQRIILLFKKKDNKELAHLLYQNKALTSRLFKHIDLVEDGQMILFLLFKNEEPYKQLKRTSQSFGGMNESLVQLYIRFLKTVYPDFNKKKNLYKKYLDWYFNGDILNLYLHLRDPKRQEIKDLLPMKVFFYDVMQDDFISQLDSFFYKSNHLRTPKEHQVFLKYCKDNKHLSLGITNKALWQKAKKELTQIAKNLQHGTKKRKRKKIE